MKNLAIIFLAVSGAALISGCNKSNVTNVQPPVSNETITTTIYQLKNAANPADTLSIRYYLNPLATNAQPTVSPDTLVLAKNATYTGTLLILDQTKTPPDTASNTIKQRSNEHEFFFFPKNGLVLSDSATDVDTNVPPLPVGLKSQIKTGNTSKGTLEIILRHQPNVKNGTYAPGSTDLDVTYPVAVK